MTAIEAAELFFKEIVRLHGIPKTIISDRDPKFTSKFWKALFQLYGTTLSMSSAYHPQTDGQSERTNRTLEQMLRNVINYRQNDWDQHLPAIELAYNNSVNATTKMTPFQVAYGYEIDVPASILFEDNSSPSLVPSAQEFHKNYATILQVVKENIARAQDQQAKHYDKRRKHEIFVEGDMVLLSTTNVQPASIAHRPKSKLQPRYCGPFRVSKVISDVAYKLDLPPSMRVHPVFHVSVLKRYMDPKGQFPQRHVEPPLPLLINDALEYEVEQVLDKRVIRTRGKPIVQYLVKWKGYQDHDNSWEPEENLEHARLMIKDFKKNNDEDIIPRRRGVM